MSISPASPVTPRPAATVMVVRPAGESYEVFMVRRHQASKFAADVFVFPGGTIRADDRLEPDEARAAGFEMDLLHAALAAHGDPLAAEPDGGLSLWSAALRELFEEAGVLLADGPDGAPVDLAEPARAAHFESLRNDLQAGRLSLAELARAEGLRLAPQRLVYFSRWITPSSAPRRFDARFFVAGVPAGQVAAHCQIETVDGLWLGPREVLGRHAADDFPMMFVTREHVKRLAEFDEIDELLDYARVKPVRVIRSSLDPARRPSLNPEQGRPW